MKKFILSPNKKTIFIMGAGASKDDNIPIQKEILDNILKSNFAYKPKNSKSTAAKEYKRISSQLKNFIKTTFGNNALQSLSLESLFNVLETSLDKRENIGKYDLKDLRNYYRDLIQGIMYVTRTEADIEKHNVKKNLKKSKAIESPYTELGVKIYKKYKAENINFAFINFNYDICLDRVLFSMYDKDSKKSFDLDYSIDLGNYLLSKGHKFSFGKPRQRGVFLLRPHGSVNWLFCRSCGQVFSKLARQNKAVDIREGTKCYHCRLSNLEPYIVYPSHNRIYENKHLVKIWMKLEELLMQADKWCFVGYSLPEADRYFSYILTKVYNYRKTVKSAPEISVVNINKTVKKYDETITLLKKCENLNGCVALNPAESYLNEIKNDRDIFSKFEIYFDNVVKYECSFKDFTDKYFDID